MLSYLEKAPALSTERKGELFSFTESLGLKFEDYRLLNLAFTHTSYANECKGEVDNNERLEFLGDSILGMITAEYLFSSFTRFHEGEFSKIKAVVVSEESLSEIAMSFHFDKYILVGRGERSQQGMMKKAILADALEAVASEHSTTLGPHQASIANVVEEIRSAEEAATEPVDGLSDMLNDVAEGYQEVIDNDRFSGVGN